MFCIFCYHQSPLNSCRHMQNTQNMKQINWILSSKIKEVNLLFLLGSNTNSQVKSQKFIQLQQLELEIYSNNIICLLKKYTFMILQPLIYKLNLKLISFIYNNLMLFRIIGNFWFCADKFRYNAAETVLNIVFNSNFKTTITHNNQIIQLSYLLLHDQIFQKLNQMLPKDSKALNSSAKMIDIQTYDLFKKMFTPSQGIQYEKLIYFSQSERLTKAQNINNLIAFCLDPIMFKLILKQMYIKNINAKLMKNHLADNVIYIVGTPGLGKSVKFIAAKILLDMRIRWIIKNGVQSQSQFAQNYKFFYFHAETNKMDIMSKTLEEVKKDFDVVPSQITSIKIHQQNYQKFMSEVSSIYLEKNIRLRLILDQMNFIYNAQEQQRAEQIRKWKVIRGCFQLPVIMVSSKNNQYLKKYDPVIFFSNSSNNNIRYIKIILDNLISPKERFAYSFSCFAFELLKYDLSRTNLIEIIQTVSLPLLNHLTISKIVKNAFKEQNGSLDNKNNMIKFNQKLKQKLNQNEILESVKNMLTGSRLQPQKLNYYLDFISKFLSFNIKNTAVEHISLNVGFKDPNENVSSVVQKQIKIATREIRKNQNFRIMTESKYFFTTQINYINSVFSCISVQQIDRIRYEIGRFLSTKFLQNLEKMDASLLNNLIQNSGEYIFYEFVCNLYSSVLKNQKIVNTLITGDKSFFHQTYIAGYMSQMNKKKNYQFLFEKEEKFLKNASGKPVFDFILSSFSTDSKRLIFVDTTLSDRLMPLILKQCKFKKFMFQQTKRIKQQTKMLNQQGEKQDKSKQQLQKKELKQITTKNLQPFDSKQTERTQKLTSFENQIFNLLNSNSKFTLQIIYYVLTAKKYDNKNYFKKIEQSECSALKQLEQISSADTLTKKKNKESIQIIRQGRQNFKQFKELLKQNGLESRINILFMHGALQKQQFIVTSVDFTDHLKSQISDLPQYLVRKQNKILENNSDSQYHKINKI